MTRVLVDGSNLWIRAYTSTNLTPPGGPVYVVTTMLRKICKEFGRKNTLICWDTGSGGRRELDPDYKKGRHILEGAWTDILHMKAMVDVLGIANAWAYGYEADDIIGSLTQYLTGEIQILSYDRDFYQLVSPTVKVLHPERTMRGKKYPRRLIDDQGVEEEFGCRPDQVVVCRSFKGDAADNIPKLPIRFMPKFKKTFHAALKNSTCVDDIYQKLDLFDKKHHAALTNFRERALLNEKLLKIHTDVQITAEEAKMNRNGFDSLCQELKITRLNFEDWTPKTIAKRR